MLGPGVAHSLAQPWPLHTLGAALSLAESFPTAAWLGPRWLVEFKATGCRQEKAAITSPGVIQTRCGLRPMGVVTVGLAKAQRQEIVLENAALRSTLWDQRSCPAEGVNPSEPKVGEGFGSRWWAQEQLVALTPGKQQSSLQRRL